jgi:transcriptional regulator with XRE-family HTH domain
MNILIKKMREKYFNYSTLAQKLGIPQPTLWNVMNRKRKRVDYKLLKKLCGILNLEMDDFFIDDKDAEVLHEDF